MTTSTTDQYRTTYHRDHTVTVWNVYTQQWERTDRPSDRVLASLSEPERARVMRHCGLDQQQTYTVTYPLAGGQPHHRRSGLTLAEAKRVGTRLALGKDNCPWLRGQCRAVEVVDSTGRHVCWC